MHLKKQVAYCPVCPKLEGQLGYFTKGENCTFLCKDCNFWFTWNREGKLLPPVKNIRVRKAEKCDCGGCEERDSKLRD